MDKARMAATRTCAARPVALTAFTSKSCIASQYSSISPPSTTAVASNTRHAAYCSAGRATPARKPAVQAGMTTSSTLDNMVSCPSSPVAYCVTALNRLRKYDSRLAERFSVGTVDANDSASESLLDRDAADRAARDTCSSSSSVTDVSGPCSSNSAKSSSRSRAVVTESATVYVSDNTSMSSTLPTSSSPPAIAPPFFRRADLGFLGMLPGGTT
mmetsp:Transcript_10662/g.23105  ORF Transcript_10662/g.23105 Transcript_10662/m.23105 type:complete len:214 (+) Transcript_10662:463-1104(+)